MDFYVQELQRRTFSEPFIIYCMCDWIPCFVGYIDLLLSQLHWQPVMSHCLRLWLWILHCWQHTSTNLYFGLTLFGVWPLFYLSCLTQVCIKLTYSEIIQKNIFVRSLDWLNMLNKTVQISTQNVSFKSKNKMTYCFSLIRDSEEINGNKSCTFFNKLWKAELLLISLAYKICINCAEQADISFLI